MGDDFKKMRKLQLQKSVELQLGRKRRPEEMSDSGSDADNDNSDSDAETGSSGDEGLEGRMPGFMCALMLKGHKKKGRSKAERIASVVEGRTDYKARLIERHAQRKGGTNNKEKKRNKPIMMTRHSARAQASKGASSTHKMANLKGHIKT